MKGTALSTHEKWNMLFVEFSLYGTLNFGFATLYLCSINSLWCLKATSNFIIKNWTKCKLHWFDFHLSLFISLFGKWSLIRHRSNFVPVNLSFGKYVKFSPFFFHSDKFVATCDWLEKGIIYFNSLIKKSLYSMQASREIRSSQET